MSSTDSLTTPSRHLFGPGPTNPYPEATAALAAPLLGHLDPAFLDLMDETCAMLRTVWGTDNRRTLPLSATGSAGMTWPREDRPSRPLGSGRLPATWA